MIQLLSDLIYAHYQTKSDYKLLHIAFYKFSAILIIVLIDICNQEKMSVFQKYLDVFL